MHHQVNVSFELTSSHILMFSFFERRFHYIPDEDASLATACPEFKELMERFTSTNEEKDEEPLDQELQASGFKQTHRKILGMHTRGEEIDEDLMSDSEVGQDSPAGSLE